MRILLCLVGFLLVISLHGQGDGTNWAYRNLRHMSFLLTYLEASETGFGEMLSDADAGDKIGVVSAEKVFRKLFEEHRYPYDWLVDTNYQHAVKPVNPEGKTAVDKWGSSFETWSMSAARWEGVRDFRWGWKGFPVMWTKKPELYGGTGAYLAFQDGHGSAETLPGEQLELCLKAAREWLEPEGVSFDAVMETLRTGSSEERNFAIRLLGRKKVPKAISVIGENLLKKDSDVRGSCFWALSEIGDDKAFPVLIKAFYVSGISASSVSETMCRIDRGKALLELQGLLEDNAESKGRKNGIVSGIFRATLPPLDNLLSQGKIPAPDAGAIALDLLKGDNSRATRLAVPLLNDDDQRTRHSAMDTLTAIGWKPKMR